MDDSVLAMAKMIVVEKKKRWLLVVWGTLCIAAGLAVVAFHVLGDPEERAVKRLIEEAVSAIEEENADKCLSLLHESYKDNMGHDYDTVASYAEHEFDDISNIDIKICKMSVDVERGVATANFKMRFRAWVTNRVGRTVPVTGISDTRSPLAQAWEAVAVRCIKRDGRWLITEVAVENLQRSGLD